MIPKPYLIALLAVTILVFAVSFVAIWPDISGNGANSSQATANNCGMESSSTTPGYDRQMVLMFDGSFTGLSYNVSAIPQNDSLGYGPAYLLNGLSNERYWYQIGLAWNLAAESRNGSIAPGFSFVYEVWSPNNTAIFPSAQGSGIETVDNQVRQGDFVHLSLGFSNGNVTMEMHDWNMSATFSSSYWSI